MNGRPDFGYRRGWPDLESGTAHLSCKGLPRTDPWIEQPVLAALAAGRDVH
jgi:hypothetical protein